MSAILLFVSEVKDKMSRTALTEQRVFVQIGGSKAKQVVDR